MAIRSDVVGSLLRPPALVQAREGFEAGRLDAAVFKRIEDQAVDEAIALQEAAGLDVITDGEQRRYAFFGHLIEMDNAVIGGHSQVTFGLHICRGNNQSMFYASGGYEPIARVFSRARFQRFLLEYDDERSGGFEPLRAVPEDRLVVLGLVTTKKPRVESVDELRERIAEAARLIPLDRLALSPQCGFA